MPRLHPFTVGLQHPLLALALRSAFSLLWFKARLFFPPELFCLSLYVSLLPHFPFVCSICQACNFSTSDSRPFLVLQSVSPSLSAPSAQSTANNVLWRLRVRGKHIYALKPFLLFLFVGAAHLLLWPVCLSSFCLFLPHVRAHWRHWPGSLTVPANPLRQDHKSLILSTIQSSFKNQFLFFFFFSYRDLTETGFCKYSILEKKVNYITLWK